MTEQLQGTRVLVVEDNFLAAMALEELLHSMGCEVIGPAPKVAEALHLIEHEPIDAAVLDVNLNGEMVFPVAHALKALGIPMVFATGYDARVVDRNPAFQAYPCLQKPYPPSALTTALHNALALPAVPDRPQ
jgi:CheY-like chemotaxis protein